VSPDEGEDGAEEFVAGADAVTVGIFSEVDV